MANSLYLECNTGISGDMTVAALLDLGADEATLRAVLEDVKEKVGGFEIAISRVQKAGIDCCDFDVILEQENHDHDMHYLHGHEHPHTHEEHHHHDHGGHHHEHEHEHEHPHEAHGHSHEHHHHHHGRHLGEIEAIIHDTEMTAGAKALALKIFRILAEAEAKAHAKPIEEVHFHEVGAVDSIVDILSVAVCLDNLQVKEVIVPKLCEGTGTVRCQHGILPIPVPATANIVSAYHLPLEILPLQGELVTPTGAAIVAAIKTGEKLPGTMRIEKIGIGAGKRQYERPSMLRAMLLSGSDNEKDTIWKLETNIDDCTGEALGHVMEQLLAAGARDVHYIPVYMKKNRPGWQLNVLCDGDAISKLETIIFRETTTIGIRRCPMERTVLPRQQRTVQTAFGTAEVKACLVDGKERVYPEHASVEALCKATGQPYQEVYRAVLAAAAGR